MARLLGIDIGATHVRSALLLTAYRRLSVERVEEVSVEAAGSIEAAVRAVAGSNLVTLDGIGIAIPGDGAFSHRITLPAAASKQLEEVLGFELEAQVPVDIDDLTWGFRVLRRESAQSPLTVLTGAARTTQVKALIARVKDALGREPERVGFGPMVLANLASVTPDLKGPGAYALVDLGAQRTEVVLLSHGEPVFARTLSRGVADLPDGAVKLAAELKQTFLAWDALPGPDIQCAYLLGGGAAAQGADAYFSHHLGVPVNTLPRLGLEGLSPEQSEVQRFAKALSLALGVAGREHDIDLRRGSLAFQRGFGFLKEKMPLLSGLGGALLLSFGFASWSELQALGKESDFLTAELQRSTKAAFDKSVDDPEQATELLEQAKSLSESDPMPHMDAFDAVVEVSKAIPTATTHDIEDFEMQRGHVKLQGIVNSTEDATLVSNKVGEHPCVGAAKISKITQVVNSTRQKYVLEFDVKCPEDEGAKKKKSEGEKADAPAEKGGQP